jgi:hypothetical protein
VKFVERKTFNDNFDDHEMRWGKLCRRRIRDHSLGHHGGEVPSSERRRTQVFILTVSVADPIFLHLLDPDPDPHPLVRGTDPTPDPSLKGLSYQIDFENVDEN